MYCASTLRGNKAVMPIWSGGLVAGTGTRFCFWFDAITVWCCGSSNA
jgi:hypothetical protein